MKKIVFIQLLNNYSGSPKVLSTLVRIWIDKGYTLTLVTSTGDGFLSGIAGANYIDNGYRYSNNKIITLLFWLWAQIKMFFIIATMKSENSLFYINTIMPIGAAWACKLTGKKMVYHVHENMQQRKPLYGVCRWTYNICNSISIFVSNYLKTTATNCREGHVVYNGLEDNFCQLARSFLHNQSLIKRNEILMVAGLKRYKGVYEFIELARRMPHLQFSLVVSASEIEVEIFRMETTAPANVTIYPIQTNLHPFYQRAMIVLQMSHPNSWVETFGLTILEAMTYSIPVVGPNVGGPKELILDDMTGYQVDPTNIDIVIDRVNRLVANKELYNSFAVASLVCAQEFQCAKMATQIEKLIFRDI